MGIICYRFVRGARIRRLVTVVAGRERFGLRRSRTPRRHHRRPDRATDQYVYGLPRFWSAVVRPVGCSLFRRVHSPPSVVRRLCTRGLSRQSAACIAGTNSSYATLSWPAPLVVAVDTCDRGTGSAGTRPHSYTRTRGERSSLPLETATSLATSPVDGTDSATKMSDDSNCGYTRSLVSNSSNCTWHHPIAKISPRFRVRRIGSSVAAKRVIYFLRHP